MHESDDDLRMRRARTSQSNVPAAALRWSVERAAPEFGMTHNTLRKLLNKNSAQADADGLYSTKQITDAVFGGLADEKLATQRQMTRKLELENAITEASVLDRKSLESGIAALADAMIHRIMASEVSRETKEDLLKDLATIPVTIASVARSQTKLPRSKNGQKPEDVVIES
jgi:hypothetical protein